MRISDWSSDVCSSDLREARSLRAVGLGTDGRDKLLVAGAALAWRAMHDAAAIDGVELLLISAFRSIEFQAALVRDKRAPGITIDEILMVNDPPGYSDHQSGRANDTGTRGNDTLAATHKAIGKPAAR